VVLSSGDIPAGNRIQASLSGKPAAGTKGQSADPTLPLALGGGLLGVAMLGVGVRWWRRPTDGPDEENARDGPADDRAFQGLIAEIAGLDELRERGEVEEDRYRDQRKRLQQQAKDLLNRQERQSTD